MGRPFQAHDLPLPQILAQMNALSDSDLSLLADAVKQRQRARRAVLSQRVPGPAQQSPIVSVTATASPISLERLTPSENNAVIMMKVLRQIYLAAELRFKIQDEEIAAKLSDVSKTFSSALLNLGAKEFPCGSLKPKCTHEENAKAESSVRG